MARKEVGHNYELSSTLEALLALPERNLEERIADIEAEIVQRRALSNLWMTEIGTDLLQVEDRLFRLRYHGDFTSGGMRHPNIRSERDRMHEMRQKERVTCFQDISRLKERLREAKEELTEQRARRRLVGRSLSDSESKSVTSTNP